MFNMAQSRHSIIKGNFIELLLMWSHKRKCIIILTNEKTRFIRFGGFSALAAYLF